MLSRAGLVAALLSALAGGCAERPPPDAGSYVVRGAAGRVVSTDCLGPGQPDARGSWPDDDARRHRFLPPGCSAATAMAGMAVDPDDLLRGRPLAPGAALPIARAIERYYDRGEDPAATATTQATPAATPSPSPAGAPAGPAPATAAPGDSAAGLLQGPLTSPVTAPVPAP